MALSHGLVHPTMPQTSIGAGLGFDSAVTAIPTGGEVVAYVHSSGTQNGTPASINARVYTTLNAALAVCRSGKGDIVMVLPGHAENVSSADQMSNLVSGTRIIGMGTGSLRPTFTWTTATATFLLDVADVQLINLNLIVATSANSGVSVAAPITVSATDCAIKNCRITAPGDANDLATIPITVAAAPYFEFSGNVCIGATAAISTAFLSMTSAVAGIRILNNYISWATSSVTVGSVRATAAVTNILICGNYIANNVANSQEALTLVASVTGFMDNNNLAVLDNASIEMDENGDINMGDNNYISNVAGERGVRIGTVSA